MSDGRWANTELGPVWQPGKSSRSAGQTPEGRLKAAARKAYKAWKLQTGIKCRRLPYSVAKVKTMDGKRNYQIGTTGTGDDLIGLCGTTLMVEYKADGRTQSDGQIKMQRDWEATGQPYVVVRKPTDLTDALAQIAAQRGHIF